MDDFCKLITEKYDGSLKAEHGTGRNVAPFVELEWGAAAYSIMKSVKDLLDPKSILNPGVLINPDPQGHIKNLKPCLLYTSFRHAPPGHLRQRSPMALPCVKTK